MLNHPHLVLVESNLPTLKNALKWVETKCYIRKSAGELVCKWGVEVEAGIVVLLWRASVQNKKVMAHSRLPYVIEMRDCLVSIYKIENVEPYLLDLKLMSESYDFTSELTNEQKRERHLQQMREWYYNNKEKHQKRQRINYQLKKYPLNGGCPNP